VVEEVVVVVRAPAVVLLLLLPKGRMAPGMTVIGGSVPLRERAMVL